MTFRDILRDYQNYRNAYFFTQVTQTPKQEIQKYIEKHPVDLKNYSTKETLKWLVKHRNAHPKFSANNGFISLGTVTILVAVVMIARMPFNMYYSWKDPLIV